MSGSARAATGGDRPVDCHAERDHAITRTTKAMLSNRRRLSGLSVGSPEYRASAFVCSEFGDGLERLRSTGYSVDWLEQKGWLGSVFFVRGHPAILAAIQKAADRHADPPGRACPDPVALIPAPMWEKRYCQAQ